MGEEKNIFLQLIKNTFPLNTIYTSFVVKNCFNATTKCEAFQNKIIYNFVQASDLGDDNALDKVQENSFKLCSEPSWYNFIVFDED